MRPDFGPGEPYYDDDRASDERAERDALRREQREDEREMRETGTYGQRDYEMDVNA